MKLIELLRETLQQWPAGFNYITQEKTGYIYASIDKPVFSGGGWVSKRNLQKVAHAELCDDWDQTILTKTSMDIPV